MTSRQPSLLTRPRDDLHRREVPDGKASYSLTYNALQFLRRRFAQKASRIYINEGDMDRLRIKCTDLEFDPTLSLTRTGALLELMSAQEMERLAQAHTFPEAFRHNLDRPISNTDDFHAADSLVGLFVQCLYNVEKASPFLPPVPPCDGWDPELDEDDSLPMLHEKSPWEIRSPSDSENRLLQCLKPPAGPMWMVPYILYSRDGSSPHLTCFVIDGARPREDALLFSEVWCLLAMSWFGFLEPENRKHQNIPVTVISGSCRQFRIIQGYANGETGGIDLRKTPIVDFAEAHADRKDQHWHEFMTFLRWMLARPVGKTT
ncbi:hypothetical protein F5Y10DRAFT_256669 [Nemania abortiva]|nr:hypothetical protein F5Y10DRAFT_256669 [Nemania abortiva]